MTTQRRVVWKVLKDAGLMESEDPRVQELLRHIRDNPDRCWEDFIADFREQYYDLFDKVVPALQESDNATIRNILIEFANPEQPKEQQLLEKIATDVDLERDELAASRLSNFKIKRIDDTLKRRMAARESSESSTTAAPTRARTTRARRANP
jgi:hypothetical protein